MAWAYFSQSAKKSTAPMIPTRDELQFTYYDDGVMSYLVTLAIVLAIQVDIGIYAETVLTRRLRGHARTLPRQSITKYVTENFSAEPNQPLAFWRRVQGVLDSLGASGKLGGMLVQFRFSTPGALIQAALESNLAQPFVLNLIRKSSNL